MKRRFAFLTLFLLSLCLHSQTFSELVIFSQIPDTSHSYTCYRHTSETDSTFVSSGTYKNGKLINLSFPGYIMSYTYDSSGKIVEEKLMRDNGTGYLYIDSFYYDSAAKLIRKKNFQYSKYPREYCSYTYDNDGKLKSVTCQDWVSTNITGSGSVVYGDTIIAIEILFIGTEYQSNTTTKYSASTQKLISKETITPKEHEIEIYKRDTILNTLTTTYIKKKGKKQSKTDVAYSIADSNKHITRYYNRKGKLLYTDIFRIEYY